MKRYKKYMDEIKASDTLRQRLRELEAPAKRPVPWKKYGSIAAALVLVLGLGGYGLYYWNTVAGSGIDAYMETVWALKPASDADIATEDPGAAQQPGEKVLGSYDVTEEQDGFSAVCHYILPYIEYGGTDGSEMCADWDIPKGAVRRDLSQEEIITLLGGEDAVDIHLDWSGYELTGWGAWYENGGFWGAYIMGYAGPLDHFEFAVTAGQLPPACIVYPGSVTQEVRGLTVTADKHDGEHGCGRRVSFMKDEYGYRFDLTSTDAEQAERLVSRLVCCVADERLALPRTCPDCGMPDVDKPPAMQVNCGGDSLTIRSGSYSWSYAFGNGETSHAIADGVHPLDFQGAPSLATRSATAKLSIPGSPARIAVECWPDSWRNSGHATGEELSVECNSVTMNYGLELKEGGWIYEVSACWPDGNSARYVFCIVKN